MSLESYFATAVGALASLLMSIAIWQLRALGRSQTSHAETLVFIKTVLTGATGDNGLVGDVKELKGWRETIEGHWLPRRVEALEGERRMFARREEDRVL